MISAFIARIMRDAVVSHRQGTTAWTSAAQPASSSRDADPEREGAMFQVAFAHGARVGEEQAIQVCMIVSHQRSGILP